MKALVIKSNLKEGISVIERASGENQNLPILRNVLIEALDGRLALSATNLEVAVRYFVQGKILEEGTITAPIQVLSNLVGNLPTERLNLETKDMNLIIKTDNYDGTLVGAAADDFPIIPKIENDSQYIEIAGDVLRDALSQVVVATQTLDLRPELGSVLFDFSLDALKLIATDSFRLAEKTLAKSQFTVSKQVEAFKILVPLRTAQEILRITKPDETVRIFHDKTQVLFRTEHFEFVSRLFELNFPDYSGVLPGEFLTEMVVNRQELINAVKLAGVLGGRNSEVRLNASKEKKTLQVFSGEQAVGENSYILSAKIKGHDDVLSFNWRYLVDGLRALKADEVFLGIYQENRKVFIKDASDSSYFYILVSLAL